MYSRYAKLFHWPSVLIKESSIPLEAAVVAAPMQKLWPAYLSARIPALFNASRTAMMNLCLLKLKQWANLLASNQQVCQHGCHWAYLDGTLPIYRVVPLRKGSVFEALSRMLSVLGCAGLSTARSPQERWVEAS